ncbi:uncharacterized protein At1g76660 isoform X2 [Arabidopsis lyrata subsp. lyrata]|uniref:uncharacterized protein At1g76660 isoform X2 n=1 Tax=Arabidopsis lyrata subsp. lyrata TaxID=81972 RepID=UPI000A29CE96|nr:uncharacterized protein At1g76660 isoform X2 [Arabidopsis lyrata subsp. lyrata]|eukprot:XP_020865588.1 uncharacterized protein At1g76660 isoform X2 [Arabidopsis lyrata subsp. lyrata]
MRSGASGNNVFDTINAAASAIASSDDRLHQSSPIPKRKWWNRWSLLKCFRSSRQRKRIGNSVLVPEPVSTSSISTSNSGYRSVITTLPFIAPPSSPASFFQSEPPSATQSPVGILSFSPLPCNNRPSIFAIGPYAHETQLVSPPVFSTYTTEPSSAPITPPLDESSIYLTTTTPSSPEVPFAQLFNSNHQTGSYGHKFPMSSSYEFQFYQLPPGSPLGQLISPSSVVSGSGPTSPFPDGETALFPHFQVSDPPKLLSPGKLQCPKTGVTTPSREQKIVRPHKPVSFDLDADHVIRCVDQKLRTTFPEASSNPESMNHSSLGSNKEFNFGTDEKHLTVDEQRASPKNSNDWSFFPVMQSGTLS